jgi:hypothetical protein
MRTRGGWPGPGTLDKLADLGPMPADVRVHLDAGYDSQVTRDELAARQMTGQIAHKGEKAPIQASQRWPVERANAWHNAFNRLQRCYERREMVIDASFDLADAIITVRSLIRRAWTFIAEMVGRDGDHDHPPFRATSKPVPVHAGSLRSCSPACALLSAAWCLAASRIAPPVHGVSTTPATTPRPPSAWPAGRSADPARHFCHPAPRAQTQGNPLALLGPWGLTSAELAGGFGLPDAVPWSVHPYCCASSFSAGRNVVPSARKRAGCRARRTAAATTPRPSQPRAVKGSRLTRV